MSTTTSIKRKGVTININVENETETKKVKVESIDVYTAISVTDHCDEPEPAIIGTYSTREKAETALLKVFKAYFVDVLLVLECMNERFDYLNMLNDIHNLNAADQIEYLHNYKHNCDNYSEPALFFVQCSKLE